MTNILLESSLFRLPNRIGLKVKRFLSKLLLHKLFSRFRFLNIVTDISLVKIVFNTAVYYGAFWSHFCFVLIQNFLIFIKKVVSSFSYPFEEIEFFLFYLSYMSVRCRFTFGFILFRFSNVHF